MEEFISRVVVISRTSSLFTICTDGRTGDLSPHIEVLPVSAAVAVTCPLSFSPALDYECLRMQNHSTVGVVDKFGHQFALFVFAVVILDFAQLVILNMTFKPHFISEGVLGFLVHIKAPWVNLMGRKGLFYLTTLRSHSGHH